MLFYHGQKSCRMNAENYAADDVSGVSLWRGGWFDVYLTILMNAGCNFVAEARLKNA